MEFSSSHSDEPTAGEDAAAKRDQQRLVEFAEVRAVFGLHQRAFFILRLWTGEIMDLVASSSPKTEEAGSAAAGVTERSWAASVDADGVGPQLPPEALGLASYGHRFFARSAP